jgi:hypothetical protein
MKQLFKIPVTWELYGVIVVEAESLDEAIEIFDKEEQDGEGYSLPEGDYIDGSFKREDDETCKLIANEE